VPNCSSFLPFFFFFFFLLLFKKTQHITPTLGLLILPHLIYTRRGSSYFTRRCAHHRLSSCISSPTPKTPLSFSLFASWWALKTSFDSIFYILFYSILYSYSIGFDWNRFDSALSMFRSIYAHGADFARAIALALIWAFRSSPTTYTHLGSNHRRRRSAYTCVSIDRSSSSFMISTK
jgi:hypothetical protein